MFYLYIFTTCLPDAIFELFQYKRGRNVVVTKE